MRRRREPKVSPDGLCACGCGRPLPRSKEARRYAGSALDSDPFATTVCARAYFGCSLPETLPQQRQRERYDRDGGMTGGGWETRSIVPRRRT